MNYNSSNQRIKDGENLCRELGGRERDLDEVKSDVEVLSIS